MRIRIDTYPDIETGKFVAELDGWPDFHKKFTYSNPKTLVKHVTDYLSEKLLKDLPE